MFFVFRSLKSVGKLEFEEIDAEVLRISFTKSPVLHCEDKASPLTPEMSRRSKTPRYMEVDCNVNGKHGAYSNSPDRGYHTPRSDGRKSAALVHIDLSKKLKIQEPQRTPRIAPNNVLRLEMKPPSPRENQKRDEESPCRSPKEHESRKPRDSTPQKLEKDSPPRKVDKHENKTGKNSPALSKGEKDSSKQSKNVDKSKKNTKNVNERTNNKKVIKRNDSKSSVSEQHNVTQNKKDLKRNEHKTSSLESSIGKDKGPKGNRRSTQKTDDTKRRKSELLKTSLKKLPHDPMEYHHYSDDFDESGDASDIEEGEFVMTVPQTDRHLLLDLEF